MTTYRLRFQVVAPGYLKLYTDADPAFYSNSRQIVPNSHIPDRHWQDAERITDDPWSQYDKLREWAGEDREFVRNVTLERQVAEPKWEEITDGPPDAADRPVPG